MHTMKKIVYVLLALAACSFSAVVGPSQSSLAILLDASGLCKEESPDSWNKMQMDGFLKEYGFYGNANSVHCHSYDASFSPAEAAVILFKGQKSVFNEALEKWAKSAGPLSSEMTPTRFVIIAEGVAGLAVREYIQSKDYQGEIDNVIFFNTPHEGTGFADQALLNESSVLNKSKSVSDYSDIIPLALAVYLVGGGDALENLMMSLLKEAVLGMVQNAGNIKANFKEYFEDRDKSYKSLLYLAQDLDLADSAYNDVKKKAKEKGLELNDYAGSTQLLNSYSKLNSFDHPAYNNVYSYGLPTIGNGRRTLADFAEQPKNHVSKEKLQRVLTESLSATLSENGKNVVPNDIANLVSDAVNGDFASGALNFAHEIAEKYDIPFGQVSGYIQDVSTLSKLKFNKENLSKSVLKIIGIANKYLPEEYKSELYSTFIDEYSEKVSELRESAQSIKGELKKGMGLVSNNLSNYAINFFDEGTFDVPAFSAIGKNVQAFKESSVFSKGYSLSGYVQEKTSDYSELNAYMRDVSKVGELEQIRQDVDEGLKYGCLVANIATPAAEKACRAAQFMANVALIADISSKIESAVENVTSLKSVKYVAIKRSMEQTQEYSSWHDHEGVSHDIASSDVENMLFGVPVVSLQSVRRVDGSAEYIVPLALYRTFGEVKSYNDISSDSIPYGYQFPVSEFAEISRNSLTNSSTVMVKDVQYEQKNGFTYKNVRYAALDAFTVKNFIEEFRFVIDDFQPDELRLIKLDFNARMQIAFERDGERWFIYRGKNNNWDSIDTLYESPVQKDGLFVFRPKDVLNRDVVNAKDSILLSAIQEDGANSVSIYVVNKVGKANNQRITFKFQAVDYIMDEGWPRSFERVSRMDTVDFYSNDWGYGASLGKYRLIVSDSLNKDTVQVYADSLPGNGVRYRFWADLSPIWKKHPLRDAVYTLKWDLGFKVKTLKEGGSTGEQDVIYNPQVIVWGDTSAPNLVFDTVFAPQVVSSNQDVLAYVLNMDSLDNRSLRGIRSFMVRKNTKDTVLLLNSAHQGEPSYGIGWNGNPVSWSGLVDLYVQAYDFANPDRKTMDSLAHVVEDSARSSWSLVMVNDSIKPGINGLSIHKTILVDNEIPQVINERVTVKESQDSTLPAFSKRKDGAQILLSAMDTLAVSFDIDENLFGRDSETVVVELVFKDSLGSGDVKSKRYLSDFVVTKTSRRFVLEEPDVNRLEDGTYDLTVNLTDEVGNKSSKRIVDKLRVDRTPPQVRGITLGDVAYGNVAELRNGTAHLMQSLDDARNRSDLACYVRVDVDYKEGKWTGPIVETRSKSGQSSNYEFDYRNAVSDTSDGFWYVYFGCFDGAGNFGKNMSFLGKGTRYPEITYPKAGPDYYTGRILIKGVAPNPEVHGNDNNGEFRILWKKQGVDTAWSEKGIEYLVYDRSLLPSERDLAVWNLDEMDKGGYVLRLSVRNCDSCKWISSDRIVSVDDFALPDPADSPKLVIVPPVGGHVAGHVKEVSIELQNVADMSEWVVKASIEAASPKDTSVYIRTVEKTFDPMTVSPFRTPAVASDTGLSIWQENDGDKWHVRYVGDAHGVKMGTDSTGLRRAPCLAIRYVDREIDWLSTSEPDTVKYLGFVMDSVKVQNEYVDVVIPRYNTTKIWNVGADSVHLIFKTAHPFTVDASTIDSAMFRDTLSPVVYIHPEKYKAHVAWNGLVNGAVPSGSLAKVNVVAYEKGNERNIVSGNESWYLEYENTGIEFSSNNLEKYYINFLGSGSDSTAIRMADYGFQFKLTGQSAFVTAKILDSLQKEVYTLLDRDTVLATAANQWKTLRWNGMKDDNFVRAGSYKIHLLVENEKGIIIDTLYPFEVSLGANIKEARVDSVGRIAELKMDEAVVDSNGDFRYVGKPDYLLRANISATVLPENERIFDYEWDAYGTQYPLMYKKTRPSLGIRRHRDEFWATVVTLVMGETKDYNGHFKEVTYNVWDVGESVCDEVTENNEYHYKIQVQQVPFRNGENVEVSVDLDPENNLHNDLHIYGFRRKINIDQYYHYTKVSFDTLNLNALVAVKILPASSFDAVVASFGNKTSVSWNAIFDTDVSDFSWDGVYKKSSYMNSNNNVNYMRDWFNNWGQTLYYEAVNKNFKVLANIAGLTNSADLEPSCETDDVLDTALAKNDSRFVCGADQAFKEVDKDVVTQFNPHAFMMKVRAVPVDGKTDFVDKNYSEEHCSYDGSGTDIKVKFLLMMDSNYWNPPTNRWGTNNLANRYVRFDPLSTTLYGNNGYVTKLANMGVRNFYNGIRWIPDGAFNNGPTVFETLRLPMEAVPENPLLFNDELDAHEHPDSVVKYYPSLYTWRFYCAKCEVPYKAVAKHREGSILSRFNSDSKMAQDGGDQTIGRKENPLDIYFEVAPEIKLQDAKLAGIVQNAPGSVPYPFKSEGCSSDTSGGYKFYGCDKWVSYVHYSQNDWNESQWKDSLTTKTGLIRNPLTDASVESFGLTGIVAPRNASVVGRGSHKVDYQKDWNDENGDWRFEVNKDIAVDGGKDFRAVNIESYVLKPLDVNSRWKIDSSKSNPKEGRYTLFNKGEVIGPTQVRFYRSKDTVYTSRRSLNDGLRSENIPLASVVAQSADPADTILASRWAKNHSAVVDIYKRKMPGDTSLIEHPYLEARYDSAAKQFSVGRNSKDIYASREDEIVTLRGSVPYDITDWNISYIQNGMRFRVADGKQLPIEATMNVNQLQGNTSFFLTYSVLGDMTYYRQLDVHIGDRVKANEVSDVYSMYGNVNIHFEKNAWDKDEDVTVRTMNPSECYDCDLFRNMVPVGPVIEVLPSHKFPEGKEPLVTVDISVQTLVDDGIDYRNLKIYKLDSRKPEIVPLEIGNIVKLLDANLDRCDSSDWQHSCKFVRINAKTPTFSEFVILDSLKADSIEYADSIPEIVEAFSCLQMDDIWMDTLWMGSANGWLEFPYLCTGKSNYLLQLNAKGNVSAEHRGASARPIVWAARNTDLYVLDTMYQSSIVFYGIDGNTEQKLGPMVRLDSVAPVIENLETSVSENEDGSRVVHVETEIEESGSGVSKTTMELFLGGNLLHSVTIPENQAPVYDFMVDKQSLYSCVGCMATIKVIVEDKGHNSDEVVKQTEKLYPYPSSLVLWYPFAEGSGKTGYELMTKDDSRSMDMILASVDNPWNGRYGVHLFKPADSASSRFELVGLDSLRPFTFELNYSAGNTQHANWAILSFVGRNGWTFGVGTYNRYFLKVGDELYYFNTKRDANIPTHLAVVVNGKNVSLYKNGEYVETIRLASELLYGGNGRLSIGARGELRSAVGNISNLRFYSSALTEEQIRGVFSGILSEESVNVEAVRVVTLADREGLMIDQSCSAPGKAYLRQKSVDNSGIMTWNVDLKADNYSLYILHRNYLSEESKIEVFANGINLGIFKLTSTGLWKSEKVAGIDLSLKNGVNEISVRPMGNLGVAALALASSKANISDNQISYNEHSWTNPEPKAKVFMKYESVEDKKWAQVRFDMRNQTDHALENAKIRYYYKGEGENVNAVSFYPGAPMSVVNDAGSVFYAEFALTEAIAAYGTVYSGQGPLIGLHRLTAPNNYFPYWDKTDDPSYLNGAETGYVEATGVALLDGEGYLLNEFACYDEDGPMQKAKINVRAMAKDNNYGSSSASDLAVYVENVGSAPVDGFEMRYYFRDTAETEVDVNWSAFATSSKINAGGDLYYVSFVYDVILNSGDKSDYGSGVQFSIHHPNRPNDFNAWDDPSHYKLNNYEMVEADSIVILDRRGNLLWGNAPQPRFSENYVTKESYAELVHREGDVIFVNIEENGYYTLETVNAIGIPLKTLYKGIWDVGEHSVTIDLNSLQPSSFIVLRKGAEILSWSLLN